MVIAVPTPTPTLNPRPATVGRSRGIVAPRPWASSPPWLLPGIDSRTVRVHRNEHPQSTVRVAAPRWGREWRAGSEMAAVLAGGGILPLATAVPQTDCSP